MKAANALGTVKRYPDYKDSGVEWIGEIPAGWEVRQFRTLAMRFSNGTTTEQIEDGQSVDKVSRIETISLGRINYNKVGYLKKSKSLNSYRLIKGDLLISHINSYDKIGNSARYLGEVPLWHGMNLIRISPKNNTNSDFLYYSLKSELFIGAMKKACKPAINQVSVPTSSIKAIRLLLPPLPEQTAIANFLDEKCNKIDRAVAQKEKLVELLKERKQIVIQHAVTKGLNPDAKLKDSGVEWIGEFPEEWGVKRLKYVLEERTKRSQTGKEPLFMVSQIHGLVVRSEFHDKAEVAQSCVGNKIVFKNDLVFNKLKAHLGVFFKSDIDFQGLVSPDYAVYKSKGLLTNLKYLELLFRHPACIGQFVIRATGIVEGLIRLYSSDLFEISIPLPSENEQQVILRFIKTESAKTDKAITLQQKQIEKLKEYKATLINSTVTGKIKVS